MTTKKKIKKTKPRHLYRNAVAAPARSVPRAVVVRPRAPLAANLAAEDDKKPDTPGWVALKAVGGALATTVAGAYLARQDWAPPKVLTGVISGLGALLALEGPDRFKSLGVGVMASAGGQLGLMLIDEPTFKQAEDSDRKEHREPVTSKPTTPAPAKRQAGVIPGDALARAYERARLRMALGAEGAN